MCYTVLNVANRREFFMLFVLVSFTIILGIYPSVITDVLHYSVSHLIYKSGSEFALSCLFFTLAPLSSPLPNKTDQKNTGSVLFPFFHYKFSSTYSTNSTKVVLLPVKAVTKIY